MLDDLSRVVVVLLRFLQGWFLLILRSEVQSGSNSNSNMGALGNGNAHAIERKTRRAIYQGLLSNGQTLVRSRSALR